MLYLHQNVIQQVWDRPVCILRGHSSKCQNDDVQSPVAQLVEC